MNKKQIQTNLSGWHTLQNKMAPKDTQVSLHLVSSEISTRENMADENCPGWEKRDEKILMFSAHNVARFSWLWTFAVTKITKRYSIMRRMAIETAEQVSGRWLWSRGELQIEQNSCWLIIYVWQCLSHRQCLQFFTFSWLRVADAWFHIYVFLLYFQAGQSILFFPHGHKQKYPSV